MRISVIVVVMHCTFLYGGPENMSMSIEPATALSNGTLIVFRGSSVSFNCSGSSFPSQYLTLTFTGSSNESLASGSGSWLSYTIENIQPSNQGRYSCRAQSNVSYQTAQRSHQLLVYCEYWEHWSDWRSDQDTGYLHVFSLSYSNIMFQMCKYNTNTNSVKKEFYLIWQNTL